MKNIEKHSYADLPRASKGCGAPAESRAYWNPRSAGHPRIPHTAGKEKWPAELQLHRCTMVH